MKRFVVAFVIAVAGLALVPQPAEAARTDSGYWMLTADGHVYGFGGAAKLGESVLFDRVDIEATPSGEGYWILSKLGFVYTYGDAKDFGSAPSPGLGESYVSMSVTPKGDGYWLFTDRGRVVVRGAAQHFGDMSGTALNGKVLGSVATPSGNGYWMVASDGGIFSFGDAKFYGSMGGRRLNQPVMSMAPDPDGVGYWLVASDGGIFAFDAGFYGSMGGTRLNKPINGIVAGAAGYLMVAADGGIFSFGNVKFHGSLGSNPPASPVVAVAVIGPPGPPPVYETQRVTQSSGTSETWTSAPFQMAAGTSTLTYSCRGTGGYVGSCYFTLKDYATGRQVASGSQGVNNDGVFYFHPEKGGTYYLEVAIFASTSRSWSFTLDQPRCIANCPPGTGVPPSPVYATQRVTQNSGTSETWTSAPFQLAAGPTPLTYSCRGTGGYVGSCYFTLKNHATGTQVDSGDQGVNNDGVFYFHPETPGSYYLEVAIFASTSRSWSFTLDQQRCTANCPI